MNNIELGKYYVDHSDEFKGEYGHDKLLIGLKLFINHNNDKDIKTVGIDVGACTGDYITHINDLCREENKHILCFEPNPVNVNVLKYKINNNNKIKLYECCLSNETTTTGFHNWMACDTNQIGNQNAGLKSGGYKICDIDVKQLDDVLDEEFKNEDFIIKFIKIDTEGNDTNVLKGLKRYLSKTKYIIFECSDCLDDFRGPGIDNPMKDAVDFLSNNGFDVYRIGTKKMFKVNDEYWNPIYEQVKFWSNCFAIKKGDPLIRLLIDNNFNYNF